MTETQLGLLQFTAIYTLWPALCFSLAIGQRYLECKETGAVLGIEVRYTLLDRCQTPGPDGVWITAPRI